MSDAEWAVPGVPLARPTGADSPARPAADVADLTAALELVLAVDPALLPPEVALARAEALLGAQDRLAAAGLRAVADVEERDLWRLRSSGSTRTWLRTLPCGDRGQLAAVRALQDRPVLGQAVQDGSVSLRTAAVLARELARVPGAVEADQLEAVLVDGLGDLLGVWAGAACLDPTPEQEAEFEARRGLLSSTVRAALQDSWSEPAAQLEPAFVLAAQVLTPEQAAAGIALLVDALQPEAQLDAAAEQEYRSRGLLLRKLKSGGWSLRAHLTDPVGQLLHDELTAREVKHPLQAETAAEDVFGGPLRAVDSDEPDEDVLVADAPSEADQFGTTGPGSPTSTTGRDVEGTPLPSVDQRRHDALARLLADLALVQPGSGSPRPARLTITAPLDALEGRPGAPPGLLHTARGIVPLTASQLRNHACTSLLSVVLLDARGRPVGASGEHRHATARERRVMRAVWGSTCAVNGCTLTGTVPHHVEPFWKSRHTRQADLAPLCEHHHHDVHEGHTTLRLRDGRLIDEHGWAQRETEQRRAG